MSLPQKFATAGLVIGATARLTRFITRDTLGEWAVSGPAKLWATKREAPAEISGDLLEAGKYDLDHGAEVEAPAVEWGWRSKLVSGLSCPFCAGFWIGLLVLAVTKIIPERSLVGRAWKLLLGALALNYVVGHISAKIEGG